MKIELEFDHFTKDMIVGDESESNILYLTNVATMLFKIKEYDGFDYICKWLLDLVKKIQTNLTIHL